jgi:Ala-tRNA(Pro) deacylase
MIDVEAYLRSKDITFELHEHPEATTCEELEQYGIPGLACKNLFLRDQKSRRFFLLIAPSDKKLDLKELGIRVIGTKVTFCNPDLLMEKLVVGPGAVGPFALLNDHDKEVEVFIDEEVYNAGLVHFHPNRNTALVVLQGSDFKKYLEELGIKAQLFS